MGKIKADIEYPFENGEVMNCTLDGVSIHSVPTKIQTSLLTQLPEMKETTQGFHHEATVTLNNKSLMAGIGEN